MRLVVVAVLIRGQKLLPPKLSVDVALALTIVGIGILIVVAPDAVPGLTQARCNDAKGDRRMTQHATGTREEWLAARLELLDAEKELTRRGDELARQRRELPWVEVEKDYRFETEEGPASLADLFKGRSQLLIYHFMFGPEYSAGCPACSAIADGFDGSHVHLENHDVILMAVSRAPIEAITAYKRRMGWTFPWASSFDTDFNFDFDVSVSEEQRRDGTMQYNFRSVPAVLQAEPPADSPVAVQAARCGTDAATYVLQRPGMSAFAFEDGIVYHTYSAYSRGVDGLWSMYQWLDRAPKGRNEGESSVWFHRRDEYGQG